MILRVLAFFVLMFSILFLPFWISVVLALAGMVYFNVFWEAIVLFLLSDLLYGVKEAKNLPAIFISFIVTTVVLIMVEIVKKKLKFYK